jgi:hypothetical protein
MEKPDSNINSFAVSAVTVKAISNCEFAKVKCKYCGEEFYGNYHSCTPTIFKRLDEMQEQISSLKAENAKLKILLSQGLYKV